MTSIPITKAVINQVHELAERDKMLHGLKITHKEGQLLFDNALFAEVDDNKNEQLDDEEYKPEDSIDEIDDIDDNEHDEMDQDEIGVQRTKGTEMTRTNNTIQAVSRSKKTIRMKMKIFLSGADQSTQ